MSERIGYIDALRGYTMILVVLCHVSAEYCNVPHNPGHFHYITSEFNIPLFFFVCGFVFYKKGVVWEITNSLKYLWKMIPILIVFPFIIFCVYVFFKDKSLVESITNKFKSGYWFTFTLFTYYVIYAVIQYLFLKFKVHKPAHILPTYIVIGLFLYFNGATQILFKLGASETVTGALGTANMQFFIFFLLGTLTRRYFQTFESLLEKSYTLLLCIVAFFSINIFIDLTTEPKVTFKFYSLLLAIMGITISFSLFRKNSTFFNNDNMLSKVLKFIGRRTLDIYLLHFFFLYKGFANSFPVLHNIVDYPLIEFFISLTIATIVIIASISVGYILRLAQPISVYCFGEKKKVLK